MIIQSEPIVARQESILETCVYRDYRVEGEGPVGIDIAYPLTSSSHWPTAILDNVCVTGKWKKGIQLANAWNAILDKVTVVGALIPPPFLAPEMAVGIDCGTSMDVEIRTARIVNAADGVRLSDPDQNGHGEGFHLTDGWLQHVGRGIVLLGSGSGGWPTPLACIRGPHIAYSRQGVWIENYTGVIITDCNFYAEPFLPEHHGIYLKNCWHVTIANNHFWRNASPPSGRAIVLDGCHNVVIEGNTAANTLAAHVNLVNGCTNVQLGTNGFIKERIFL